MQVSLSEAAKMVGITRSTLYVHIREKGISVINAKTKRPKIDVSELVRVYGDKIKPLGDNIEPKGHGRSGTEQNLAAEVALLREKIKTGELERDRERRQLSEQIENLQELLRKEQEVVGKVTALLTDQRPDKDTALEKEMVQSQKIEKLEQSINKLIEATEQNSKKTAWWRFGKRTA